MFIYEQKLLLISLILTAAKIEKKKIFSKFFKKNGFFFKYFFS